METKDREKNSSVVFLFFKTLFIFRERVREEERKTSKCERYIEIHQLVASHMPPPGDLASNPGMSPDRESNLGTFGSWAGIQSTEPHQLELYFFL